MVPHSDLLQSIRMLRCSSDFQSKRAVLLVLTDVKYGRTGPTMQYCSNNIIPILLSLGMPAQATESDRSFLSRAVSAILGSPTNTFLRVWAHWLPASLVGPYIEPIEIESKAMSIAVSVTGMVVAISFGLLKTSSLDAILRAARLHLGLKHRTIRQGEIQGAY